MTNAKIDAIRAQLAAITAELDGLTTPDNDPPAADPGVEILNLANDSDRRDEPKPTPHTKADGLAEAQRRFPNRSASASDEDVDEGDEPVGDSARAQGLREAQKRFGKRGGNQ